MASNVSPTRPPINSAVQNIRKTRLASMWDPISVRQFKSTRDQVVRGPMWVSCVTFPAAGESHLSGLVIDSVRSLGDDQGHDKYSTPEVSHVQAEWVGWRCGVSAKALEPSIPERQKYVALMKDVSSSTTILYVFGGNFYYGHPTGSPQSYRRIVAKLAALTHGRVLSVGYRLAPQNAFPAALLDILVAYLSLLYPPEESYHEPVPASSVVFAGDSAGACLCLSLVQVILAARRQQKTANPTVLIRGRQVELKMPSGLALLCVAPDQTASLPSWTINASSDIFEDTLPALDPKFPTCDLWPTKPPRGNVYCEVSMLNHPLVSPVVAQNWVGSPPIWIAAGSGERLLDGAKFLAQNAADQGVAVLWGEYEAMPHLWPFLFGSWPQSQRCWENWARACTQFANGAPVAVDGKWMEVGSLRYYQVDVSSLTRLTLCDVQGYMRNHQKNAQPFRGDESKKAML